MHHGTDPVLVKDLDGIAKSGRRRDRDDRGAFVGQDSFDCHGYPPLMLLSSPYRLWWELKDAQKGPSILVFKVGRFWHGTLKRRNACHGVLHFGAACGKEGRCTHRTFILEYD